MSYLRNAATLPDYLPEIRSGTTSKNVRFYDDVSSRLRRRPFSASVVNGPGGSSLADVETEIQQYREELRKKDQLLNVLTTCPPTSPRTSCGARNGFTSTNEDLASKCHKLLSALDVSHSELDAKEQELDGWREKEARYVDVIRAQQERIRQLEAHSTDAERSEAVVYSWQQRCKDSQARLADLEARFKKQLEERESSEHRADDAEKKYKELLANLRSFFVLPPPSSEEDNEPDTVLIRIKDLASECVILKGKLASLEEAAKAGENEQRSTKDTIERLLNELQREKTDNSRHVMDAEAARVERDEAVTKQEELQAEVDKLRERLKTSQRAWEMSRKELGHSIDQFSMIDLQSRQSLHAASDARVQFHAFLAQLASMLSNGFHRTEEREGPIKDRINEILTQNSNFKAKMAMLEERMAQMNGFSSHRSRLADSERDELERRLRRYELDSDSRKVLIEGSHLERERYRRCIERIATCLGLSSVALRTSDTEALCERVCARARELTCAERHVSDLSVADSEARTLIKKVSSLQGQLDNKDTHLELMRKKNAELEARLSVFEQIERKMDTDDSRSRKYQQLCERYKRDLNECKLEIHKLRLKLQDAKELKFQSGELRDEVRALAQETEELENIRERQARKIATLKDEIQYNTNFGPLPPTAISDDYTVQQLSNELRTLRDKLRQAELEKKDLERFRDTIASMLGFAGNNVLLEHVYARLDKLLRNTQDPFAYLDLDKGFRRGYHEADRNSSKQLYRKHQQGAHKRRARTPGRSYQPEELDPRSY